MQPPAPTTPVPSPYPRHALLILSAITLGLAIARNEGTYAPDHPWSIIWLTLSLIFCLSSLFTPHLPISPSRHRNLLITLLSVGLTIQFLHLFLGLPGSWKNVDWSSPATEVGPLARTGVFPWRTIYQQHAAERQQLQEKLPTLTDENEITQTRRRIAELTARLNATKFQGFITALALLTILSIPDWRRATTTKSSKPVPEPKAQGRILRTFITRTAFPALLLSHFLLGVWIIRANPSPHIDVYVFQQEASRALLQGNNPYAMTFPNIYGHDRVYAPGLSLNNELQFGFPYPPASLLLILPSYALTGDHRYAQLLAITLSGLMIAYARPGTIARLTAALFLFTPRLFMIVECAWTEPLVVLCLSATLFTALRAPKLMPYALGLFFATKQYMLFVPPLACLLVPSMRPSSAVGAASPRPLTPFPPEGEGRGEGERTEFATAPRAQHAPTNPPSHGTPGEGSGMGDCPQPGRGEGSVGSSSAPIGSWTLDVERWVFNLPPFLSLLLKSITVTLLISLPLILWNPEAFIHSAVTLQLKQPFRPDALSYPAWIHHHLTPTLAPKLSILSFALIPLALALGLWKSPRTPSGFALALATLFFLFLVFSKQAFANYYFFLLSTICWAIAIADDLPRSREAVPGSDDRSAIANSLSP